MIRAWGSSDRENANDFAGGEAVSAFGNDQEAVGAGEGGQVAGALPWNRLDLGELGGERIEMCTAAGTKRVRSGLPFTSRDETGEGEARARRFRLPARARRIGEAKSRNVAAEEMGFPGRPKKGSMAGDRLGCAGTSPKTSGLPGWMRTPVKWKRGAEAREGRFDEVEFAGGDAAGDEKHIGVRGPGGGRRR